MAEQGQKFDLLIIGGGHAAGQLILSLAQHKYAGAIGLVTDEDVAPYQRPPLSKGFLTGDISRDRLPLVPTKTWERLNCQILTGEQAGRIDAGRKIVVLGSGATMRYETLILCTGASPRRLQVSGSDLIGVQYLRNLKDAISLQHRLGDARHVVIVGGGYIGLEVAAGARKFGKSVTLLEREDRVLPRVVAPEVSEYFRRLHESHGVEIITRESVSGFSGETALAAVETASGREISADLALIAIGIEPNISLAREAGLATDNGIEIDALGRTSDPSIYAAGDCTRQFSRQYERRVRLESVQNATDQARAIAATVSGEETPYDAVPWFWSEQYDVRIQIAGLNQGYDQLVVRGDPSGNKLSFLYLKERRLIACDAINAVADFTAAKKLISARAELEANLLSDIGRPLKSFYPAA